MKKTIPILLLLTSLYSFAEVGIGTINENEYRSVNNPHYWKNKMPYPGYWQQDVHYQLNVEIDDKEESVAGSERLVYYNNSPDTLYEVYFHLYQNAFTPNSYAHELRKSGKLTTVFGEHEAKGVGTAITHFSIDNEITDYTIDNTILHAKLNKPLFPNSKITFDITFKTYWDKEDGGNMRRRMKTFQHSGVTHFDGVHWYPRICVYDRKFGWTTDQHLGKEFYGDFGLFEVALTFPNQYIVEATGEIQNEDQVLPPKLREAIDLKNYKTSRSELTQPIKADGTKKTWRYKAVNVHDFAFTADPTYRIGEVIVDGVRCIALAQEENAHLWQNTANFVGQVVSAYSNDFGDYVYPKMVAADARDGMEYPMITLNSGNWPGHQYVIAHEVGHNWFFGMLGNNETYRSALDEGFTQFLTAWSLKKISGNTAYGNPIDKGVVFNRYLDHATGVNSATLNVHADHYNSAERHGGGYGQVYFKTATMLYNLQYVLGDELFLDAMQHYVEQWKICHPYWEDFKTSIIRYTKTDLNWFFDQWITTTKTIDYAVIGVKKGEDGSWIELERKGSMQMPLDVLVKFKDGSEEMHYISNTYFNKKTSAIKHKAWIGWDEMNKTYTFKTNSTQKVAQVIIDPSERLADVNRLNNHKKPPIKTSFSKWRKLYGNYDDYQLKWHPTIWYNGVDGLKPGLTFQGNYGNYKHLIDATAWYNTGVLAREGIDTLGRSAPVNYRLNYTTQLDRSSTITIHSRWLDGLNLNELSCHKEWGKLNIEASFKSLYRNGSHNLEYLINDEQWTANRFNNTLNLSADRRFKYFKGDAILKLSTRATALYSDYSYASVSAEYKSIHRIKDLSLKTRVFGQWITGDNIAPESRLLLSGANNEEMMEEPFFRSIGFIPSSWEGYGNSFGNWHYGGGLNLRAYNNYAATNASDGDTFYIFAGNGGAALNLELDFNRLLDPFKKIRPLSLNTYLFGDAGILASDGYNSDLRVDAGIGTALTIRTMKYNYYKPLVIRFDIPFFANRIPSGESNYIAFRYVLGISRAF